MEKKRYRRHISVVDVTLPLEHNPEKELEWIFQCLGLGDESNRIAQDIFRELVRASKERHGISSRELKDKEQVSQAAIIYHLNTFMRSGLIVKQGRLYYLRAPSLEETLEELERDMMFRLERLRRIARKLEEEF